MFFDEMQGDVSNYEGHLHQSYVSNSVMEILHILLLATKTIGGTLEQRLRQRGTIWEMGIEVDAAKQSLGHHN